MTPFSLTSTRHCYFARRDALRYEEQTQLVEEIPLAISINQITHAVMMVTPNHLDDFAIGFAFSEGIINSKQDVRDIQLEETTIAHLGIPGLALNLDISPRQFAHFKQHKHAHLGATGCGLCGKDSLEQALPILKPLPASQALPTHILKTLREMLFAHQDLGQKSGAIHAAMLLSPEGHPIICLEDIGRHNALDKIIGYALNHNISLHNHSVVMSSRCSTELIQKAVRATLSTLIHLASPSTLAVSLARQLGLTLIHLPKKDEPRIFASSFHADHSEKQNLSKN
ncbi:Protein FdhD [Marinomonas spartinae]|uniref:Sulfur carrier protein FdhD n=1 Tax=Marinomonas spartinae TaxID=1792290 RepID=A0A1A8TNB5_9GAMM|nr:formate dehydrogenase accessory sulfurtransferase FdhD [Marinomonas spartinae]SBS35303.1 Protein FdhD [Marinomonas spartinae]